MTKSFPMSLRWRVVMSRQQLGMSLDQIAEALFVSRIFVKVIGLYENTGTVNDPPRRKSKKRKMSGSRKIFT